mmetsp:Transcript_30266/g.46319  ORF Transcript_30266/g.46319 Transcript_30266/m.46319 type:complete len:858 (+) Transcript_30266:185-2758(+)|eukprot:CAMPEP_0194086286 /NCGR_PEP_ID=MMETSP0149-20130528/20551_1 /TAXON_ID=122233 /ORGANISM="Chaetoceros debilis, Strain MM31A-1" /LENGTH=857 /DNA_ID=CAMNT_0038769347 /DNA_START=120 /DNA_END=2693 /DNA_ORIENTATION=+
MELTLTGASLVDDNKTPTPKPTPNPAAASAVALAGNPPQCEKKCCDNHNVHAHGHANASAAQAQSNYQSLHSIPIDKLLSNEPVLFTAILTTVKGGAGTYESFVYLVDAVLGHESKGNVFSWGHEQEQEQEQNNSGGIMTSAMINGNNNNDNNNNCKSVLGRRWKDGHTLAHWCAKQSNLQFMTYLAHKVQGIDLNMNSNDQVGMTPLHWAATEGCIPTVNFILMHGEGLIMGGGIDMGMGMGGGSGHGGSLEDASPIDARDKSGCTPLLIAAQYGHADLAAFLIKRGADPNAADSSNDTALHWAAYKGTVPVCGLLLHLNGIYGHVDRVDEFGQTPLHLAALRGNIEAVGYILEQAEMYANGMDVEENDRDRDGNNGSRRGSGASSSLKLAVVDGTEEGDVEKMEYIDLMAEAPPSLSQRINFPQKLLTLADREGKTPHGLAIKKKKPHVELVLKEYMVKHSNENKGMISSILAGMKQFFSLKSWMAWVGLMGDTGSQPPKFIFWFVVANLALGSLYEMLVYIMDITAAASTISDSATSRLHEYTGLHIATVTSYALTWITLLLVHITDPGLLAKKHAASIQPKKSGIIGMLSSIGNWLLCCYLFDAENRKIKREMHTLTNDLRAQYDNTLESFAQCIPADEKKKDDHLKLQLCHSCHIAKPHRSKHCRVLNRCVLLFDHHCPFVGTTIGLYNYKYFYLFVVFFTTTEFLFAATGVIYLKKGEGSLEVGKLLILIYFSIYTLMTLGLTIYHTQLIKMNLTTNEQANLHRYPYLNDDRGRYTNPFNRGFVGNCVSRFFPKRNAYTIGADSNSCNSKDACCAGGDCSGGDIPTTTMEVTMSSNKKTDDEQASLVENQV